MIVELSVDYVRIDWIHADTIRIFLSDMPDDDLTRLHNAVDSECLRRWENVE